MAPQTKRVRVVVADDSPTFRRLLCAALEQDPEVEVVGVAANGAEAVDLARRLRPDVVTLDLEMPVMDGLEALRTLAQELSTPVVVLSTHTGRGPELGQLVEKVKAAFRARLPRRRPSARVRMVAASTGAPAALSTLFTHLPPLRTPVVVVQHMPPGFTASLARRLGEVGPMRVEEARDGVAPQPGVVYVAPGGRQLVVRRPTRPCWAWSSRAWDGLLGCRRIKDTGGVVEAGLADFVLPLERIPEEVARLVGTG